MLDKLLDMFRESTLMQATIALVLLLEICYLYFVGREVPPELVNFFSLVLGFYFGTKVQKSVEQLRAKSGKE